MGDGSQLPVLAFHLDGDSEGFTVFEVSRALRERGWQVPAYTFPKNREDLAVLRVVVRHGFSGELAGRSWTIYDGSPSNWPSGRRR